MVEVDYGQLSLTQQLLERQDRVHAARMVEYVQAECTLPPADLGLLLIELYPLTELSVVLGSRAFELAGTLNRLSAQAVADSLATYVEADRAAHADFTGLNGRLGGSSTPFSDPGDSTPRLGAAQSQADPGYGDPEPEIFEQAVDEGTDLGNFVTGTIGAAEDRIGGWFGGEQGVVERNDASSYLVPPMGGKAAIEDLRWSAGPLLGGVDWVFEQLFGFSLLEDVIMKPLAGNWQAIDEASIGWTNLGQAALAMAGNLSGLPEQTGSWQGDAADRFREAMAALSAATVGLSYACDYVSQLLGTVCTVSQAAASAIGFVLNTIVTDLLTLAVEGAIPVAGWVAAAAEVAIIVTQIVQGLRLVYKVVNLIFDAIYDFLDSREKLVQTAFVLEDIVEYFGKSAATSLAR